MSLSIWYGIRHDGIEHFNACMDQIAYCEDF